MLQLLLHRLPDRIPNARGAHIPMWIPARRMARMFAILAACIVASTLFVLQPTAVLAQDVEEYLDLILDTEPDITDEFGTNRDFWTTTYDGETSRYFKNGRLYISVDVADTVAYSRGDTTVDDFYAEVDTYHIAGDESNQPGIVFRYQDEDNFYFFAIGNDGYYALLKLENNSWTNLVDWTESEDVNSGSGARNRVAVLTEGPDIVLLANDVVLAEVEDSTFTEGQIALTAGSYERAGVEIAFDNFALWRLGEPVVETPDAPPPLTPATPEPEPEDDGSLLDYIDEVRTLDPAYEEDFTEGDGGWDVFETENVLSEHDGSNALVMTISAPQRLGTSVYPREVADFYMEVDVEHLEGPIDAEAGIVFREVDENNYYFYAISHDGYYSLWRKRNNEWQTLVEWTPSDALDSGEGAFNTLGILAEGTQIAVFANEVLLNEVTDEAFDAGSIALVVGTFDTGGVAIGFDGVYIWDLESAAPAQSPVQRPTDEEPVDPDSEPEAQYDAEARLTEILDTPSTFYDDFRRNTGVWELVDEVDHSFSYRQRALLGTLDKTEWIAWSVLDQDLTDYYFEVDATQLADIEDASYGIVFRLQDTDEFYQLSVSIYGNYSIWKTVGDEWIELVEWTDHPAVNTGLEATNRVGVLVEGSNLTAVVNGEVLATVSDPDFTSGPLGVALETFEETGNEVLFDNAELWDLSRE
ncbi:MAG: hypothetical protein WDZ49_12905 [Litorilinea sp.]